MKNWFLWLVLAAHSSWANALTYTVNISQQELQSKVEALMPIEKTKLFVTVVLSNPIIDLAESSNEIGLFSRILISAPGGLGGQGTIKLAGSLLYNADQGAFFLNNPQIQSIESKDVAAKHLDKVQQIAQLALEQYLSAKPIYRFKDDNMKHKLAKAVLQSVTVENQQLVVELTVF